MHVAHQVMVVLKRIMQISDPAFVTIDKNIPFFLKARRLQTNGNVSVCSSDCTRLVERNTTGNICVNSDIFTYYYDVNK